jgi:hypothetical protein
MTLNKRSLVLSATALLCALGLEAAGAGDLDGHKVTRGISVYLGIAPAMSVAKHPLAHSEATMHGGPRRGHHVHHITAALFDAQTGERIEDAGVEARVTPLGLAGETRALEPMAIVDTITYGNYFAMRDDGTYRIRLSIVRPGSRQPVALEFSHLHR